MLFNTTTAETGFVTGEELDVLERWTSGGNETGFTKRLKALNLILEDIHEIILDAIEKSLNTHMPLRSFAAPERHSIIPIAKDFPLSKDPEIPSHTLAKNIGT